MGPLSIDHVTFAGALDAIVALVRAGRGGAVFTPNVDHVVLAEHDARMRRAYRRADLCLVDGTLLVWASHLLGDSLPASISGSELVVPLLRRAASLGLRVYILGGAAGVGELARAKLRTSIPGLQVVGVSSPRIDVDDPSQRHAKLVEAVRAARPELVLVALGAPKQEIWIDRFRDALRPAVLLGLGASLDFVAGVMPRSPPWMSRSGLEWLFRLSREPRRLGYRYLVRDPRFVLVMARLLRRRWMSPRPLTGASAGAGAALSGDGPARPAR